MIQIRDIKLKTNENEKKLFNIAQKILHCKPIKIKILKKSIDARKKDNIYFVYTIGVKVSKNENKLISVLGGMYLQRKIEEKAFLCGGNNYNAPVQLVGDFLEDKLSTEFKDIIPTYKPGIKMGSMKEIFPDFIVNTLKNAIVEFDKKIKGFANPNAVITAPETRSSSPVRIIRDELKESNIKGIYPCGEGAGYAGGIVSAAVDGMICAEEILKKTNNINF